MPAQSEIDTEATYQSLIIIMGRAIEHLIVIERIENGVVFFLRENLATGKFSEDVLAVCQWDRMSATGKIRKVLPPLKKIHPATYFGSFAAPA